MAVRRIRQLGGLHTDVSALDAPEGALRQADNVLLHRPGIIQPRPGFGDTTGVTARSTSRRPIKLWPFGGDVVVQSYDGSSGWAIEKLSADTQYDTTRTRPAVGGEFRGTSDAAEARGSLYITTDAGIRKLEGISASALDQAGVVTDYVTPNPLFTRLGNSDRHAVGTQSVVAYRYCWVREDANGYVRRSAPSPRFSAPNSSATDYYYVVLDRLYLPDGIVAGDLLELYRTVNSTPESADPGDEMFLAKVHQVTSAEVSAGYLDGYAIVDAVNDGELGAALYTNASQQGILAANERPPLAHNIALWNRCLWLGNTQERHAIRVEPVSVYDRQSAYAEQWRDGVHYSANKDGDYTNGSASVANLTGVDGLKVGQYITFNGSPTLADTYVPALTKITAVTTTITINNNTNIDTSTPDYFEFEGIAGSSTEWQRIKWDSSITGVGLAKKGASASESATNLAQAINTIFAYQANLTATANGAVVTVTDDDGHGVPVTITESTGGTYTVAYSLTMDANALATGSAKTVYAHDYITVDGVEFYFSWGSSEISIAGAIGIDERLIKVDNQRAGSDTNLDQARKVAREMADAINAYAIAGSGSLSMRAVIDDLPSSSKYWYLGQGESGPTEVLLIREGPGDGSFSFEAPVRPKSFRDGSKSSEDTHLPGRLWFSKPDEPEAFTPVSWLDVGNRSARILALTALDDVLLVWKEDGLFRVTGAPPAGWVVDEIRAGQTPLRLLAPECVCVLDDVAYAWTNRGVIRTRGDDGQLASQPIGDVLRGLQQAYSLDNTDPKRGAYMVAHERLGLVILAVAASTTAEDSDYWLVYHTTTGRWSKWLREDRCAAYDPAEDRMLVAPGVDGWEVLYERSDEDSASSYVDRIESSVPISRAIAANLFGSYSTNIESWYQTSVTLTGGQSAPDGSTDAFKLADASSGVQGQAYYFVTTEGSTQYVATVWIRKEATATGSPGVQIDNAGSLKWRFTVDQETGVVTEDSSGEWFDSLSSVESDGWWIVRAAFTTDVAQTTTYLYLFPAVWSTPGTFSDTPTGDAVFWAPAIQKYDENDVVVSVPKHLIPWTPTGCDVVTVGGSSAQVASVVTDTFDYLLTLDTTSAGTESTATLVEGYAAELLWQAQHASGLGHRWQELHLEFLDCAHAYLTSWTFEAGGAAHRDSSPSSVTPAAPTNVTYSEPVRIGFPRDVVRTPQLYPYAKMCSAGALWRLAHLYLHHTPTSRRVKR